MAGAIDAANPDLVHNHGIWQYRSAIVRSWSRRTGRPYVVSPHGMLDPWAVNHSRWKKRLSLAWYEGRHLRDAPCLHALNRSEYESIRKFGLKNPVAIIPNGAVLPEAAAAPPTGDRRTLLYLGRIHPKKGLKELLQAWAKFAAGEGADWQLAIAGWDDGGYEQNLRDEAARLGIDSSVAFLGPKFGAEKARIFSEASAFILPSFSEGLPMVVLEAWAYRLPVVMTEFCNLPEGFAAGAALEVEPRPDSLLAGLNRLARLSDEERRQIGERGLDLVKEKFTWSAVADRMESLYRWLIAGAPRPDFVVTD
jgi:poly(glycerol-phosphate) alpha-glucosyltransferase